MSTHRTWVYRENTLLSAEEAMRQIVKGNLGYVITPRLLKEGEPVAAELPDYLSDFKDIFSERKRGFVFFNLLICAALISVGIY